MRNYIYKTLIAVIALIVVFEFTIGKTINRISSQTEILFTKDILQFLLSRKRQE